MSDSGTHRSEEPTILVSVDGEFTGPISGRELTEVAVEFGAVST